MYADEKKPMCDCCEEQPATRKLMLTKMDGILLDEVKLCDDCAPGAIVAKDGKNLSY